MPFVQTNPIQMLDNTANAFVIREKVGGINYVEIDTINGVEVIRAMPTGQGNVEFFGSSAEGITKYIGISGYKTSGSLTEARLGVGFHTDQVLSFYNAQGYYFDNKVGIGVADSTTKLEVKDGNISTGSAGTNIAVGETIGTYSFMSYDTSSPSGQGERGAIKLVAEGFSWSAELATHTASLKFYTVSGSSDVLALTLKSDLSAEFVSNVGIGVIPAQKFEIGSNDNSNRISIYHDNANAYFKYDDGGLIIENTEAGVNNIVTIRGATTGLGELHINDQDNLEYLRFYTTVGVGFIETAGSAPGDLRLQSPSHANIRCFTDAAEGETRSFQIAGHRTSGSVDTLEIAVGEHADQVGSIFGCANGYYFDTNVGINVTLPLATIHTLGTAIFDMTDNTGGVWKVVEGAREYIYVSTLNGSEAIDFGGPSDAVEYNFRGDGHVSIQGGLKTTNKLLAGDGFVDDATARSSEDSLLGHFHVFVTPSGSSNDYFAFGDKANGHTVLVTNNGSVNALIDQDETGGMDLCMGRTAVCRWDQGTGSWYYA